MAAGHPGVNKEIMRQLLEFGGVSSYKRGVDGTEAAGEITPPDHRIIARVVQRRSAMKEQDKIALQDGPQPLKEQCESNDHTPAELFEQMSHIAITLSYDLVDKLRYWEKETLEMSDEGIEQRLGHIAVLLERLKKAYVDFAETDI